MSRPSGATEGEKNGTRRSNYPPPSVLWSARVVRWKFPPPPYFAILGRDQVGMLLRLTLACLVARASALALQPVHARSAIAVRRAAAMMSDPWNTDADATRDPSADEEAERMAKLLEHLRKPIRQYEGGWGDTALRDGGKDQDRFGKGPTPQLIGKGLEGSDGTEKATPDKQAPTLSPEKQAMLVLPEESFKVAKLAMSQTDKDFEIECSLATAQEGSVTIDVEPMFLSPEEYFFGLTPDSDPKLSIDWSMSSEAEGEALVKGSALAKIAAQPITVTLNYDPEYTVGEAEAYLCVILPNKEHESKFYKITAKCTE